MFQIELSILSDPQVYAALLRERASMPPLPVL